jgi:predicted amidohydrolase
LLQPCSGPDYHANLAWIEQHLQAAHAEGAEWALLPENAFLMEDDADRLLSQAQPEDATPGLLAMCAAASRLGLWLLIGSVMVRPDTKALDPRLYNRSFLIDPSGNIVSRYDKIHLFDVELAGTGDKNGHYQESARFQPGRQAAVAHTPWGGVGLSICYDLRFPYLYGALAQHGAQILTVPAAFTRVTGQAHWHCLLRARAIETGCFVLAPAQTGQNTPRRETYGHSLVVSPWGEVLVDAGTKPGYAMASLDLAQVAEARRRLPVLQHAVMKHSLIFDH